MSLRTLRRSAERSPPLGQLTAAQEVGTSATWCARASIRTWAGLRAGGFVGNLVQGGPSWKAGEAFPGLDGDDLWELRAK
eukprot:15438307-Alexandrium_andersonii.AAC.1